MIDLIQRLQFWFACKCNGEWEHQHGIRIDTLDNPGWAVKIDLTDTPLHDRSFKAIDIERTELNWLKCQVKDGTFEGFGGPNNLVEILDSFLNWDEIEATRIHEQQSR